MILALNHLQRLNGNKNHPSIRFLFFAVAKSKYHSGLLLYDLNNRD